MPTKVMRYEIIKPVDCDWDEFGQVLRDIQYDTWKIANKSVQLLWEWQNFSTEYRKTHDGQYPDIEETIGKKRVDGYLYGILSKEYTRLQTGNLSITIKRIFDKWKTDLSKIYKGEISIPSFKRDLPIDLHNNSIQLDVDDNNSYHACLSLLSNKEKAARERKTGRYTVLINEGDKSSRDILRRCINKEYKVCASQILHKKNKWFLNLSYTFEAKTANVDPGKIMGMDLGIAVAVYLAVNDSFSRLSIAGKEIEEFRKQVEKRKYDLQRQGRYCGEGRIGHGIKTRVAPIDFAEEKIRSYRNTKNHCYSKMIVQFAIRNNCGIIQMEDLTGISNDKSNKFLRNWTYFDLQSKVEYKAKEVGIKVVKIKPQYTSQRCSKCGYIDAENRPEQARFVCQKCGFEANADYNAALNIATPDIGKIIEKTMKKVRT